MASNLQKHKDQNIGNMTFMLKIKKKKNKTSIWFVRNSNFTSNDTFLVRTFFFFSKKLTYHFESHEQHPDFTLSASGNSSFPQITQT